MVPMQAQSVLRRGEIANHVHRSGIEPGDGNLVAKCVLVADADAGQLVPPGDAGRDRLEIGDDHIDTPRVIAMDVGEKAE